MNRILSTFVLFCTGLLGTVAAFGQGRIDPPATMRDTIGINIHFVAPPPGRLEMLASAGIRVVRMDFMWHLTEKKGGVYDFSKYDELVAGLAKNGMRAFFILDYSNPLYDGNFSPYTDEGRAAFARWAEAAVLHFRERRKTHPDEQKIIWELYNEPMGFWRSSDDYLKLYHGDRSKLVHEDYAKLAMLVGKTIFAAAPDDIFVGPSSVGTDFDFPRDCFKEGLLQYFSGVTVHPYMKSEPETAAALYRQLRALVEKYSPAGRPMAIISGEWGYPSQYDQKISSNQFLVRMGMDEELQSKFLSRMVLNNALEGVPLSVWYDDLDDDKEHFGLIRQNGEPKPAYLALKTLTNAVGDFQLPERLDAGSEDDYVLRFERSSGRENSEVRFAAWTTRKTPHEASISVGRGNFIVVSYLGEKSTPMRSPNGKLSILLSDAPQYLEEWVPSARN